MNKIKITVKAISNHKELSRQYENYIDMPCNLRIGDVFLLDKLEKPNGLCESAWLSMYPYVMTLFYGGENIHEGWMKNKKSAMISCNDGFRPVSFYIEVIDDNI